LNLVKPVRGSMRQIGKPAAYSGPFGKVSTQSANMGSK
jgi:hypothetical protein